MLQFTFNYKEVQDSNVKRWKKTNNVNYQNFVLGSSCLTTLFPSICNSIQ